MNADEMSESVNEPAKPLTVPDGSFPFSGAKPLLTALAIALIAGLVGWILGDAFRVMEIVDEDEFYGGSELSVGLATRNGVVSYAVLGAILPMCLGLTAGWLTTKASRSISRMIVAGLLGMVVGAVGAAAASHLLMPRFYGHLETADLTLSILIHLAIWSTIGAASGLAFGIGLGRRDLLGNALVGGIAGGALGAILFDVLGAFLPTAHTERPLAELASVRLSGHLVLCAFVALGIIVVASQKPRGTAKKA